VIAYDKVVSGPAHDVLLRSWTSVEDAYKQVVSPNKPGDIPLIRLLAASSIAAAEVDKVAQSVYKYGQFKIGRPRGRSPAPVALHSALRRIANADHQLDVAPSLMTLANEACLVKLGRPLPIEDCPRPNQNSPFLG